MIQILTTGGTIDKVYFDSKSTFEVGDSPISDLLMDANLTLDFKVTEVLRKDSLELTDKDRLLIRKAVEQCDTNQVVITHGTDTMVQTALALRDISGKTIVMTGAMQPARFRATDALYNVAAALTAAQLLPPGVFIAMNGCIFDPSRTRKNIDKNCFEEIEMD